MTLRADFADTFRFVYQAAAGRYDAVPLTRIDRRWCVPMVASGAVMAVWAFVFGLTHRSSPWSVLFTVVGFVAWVSIGPAALVGYWRRWRHNPTPGGNPAVGVSYTGGRCVLESPRYVGRHVIDPARPAEYLWHLGLPGPRSAYDWVRGYEIPAGHVVMILFGDGTARHIRAGDTEWTDADM